MRARVCIYYTQNSLARGSITAGCECVRVCVVHGWSAPNSVSLVARAIHTHTHERARRHSRRRPALHRPLTTGAAQAPSSAAVVSNEDSRSSPTLLRASYLKLTVPPITVKEQWFPIRHNPRAGFGDVICVPKIIRQPIGMGIWNTSNNFQKFEQF